MYGRSRPVEHMLAQVNNISKPLIYFTNYGEIRDNTYLNNSPISAVKRLLLKPLALGEGASTLMKRSSIAFGNAICCPSVTYNLECIHQPVFKAGMRSNLDWEAWRNSQRLRDLLFMTSVSGCIIGCMKVLRLQHVSLIMSEFKRILQCLRNFGQNPLRDLSIKCTNSRKH